MDLPEDASEDDRRIVECGLQEDERKWFEDRRRELEERVARSDPNAPTDAEALVARHAIRVNPEKWAPFADWLPPVAENSAGALLSRGDVAAVAATCRGTGDWLPLLVASFMWGYGLRGYGPDRLSKVLYGTPNRPAPRHDEIRHRLAESVRVLGEHGPGDAYALLREGSGKLPHLGPAFFTKLLYFAGKTVTDVSGCQPLVLDAVLAGRMRWFWMRPRCGSPGVRSARAKWFWIGPWTPRRYRIYLAFMHRAATQLGEVERVWTPDLVELILFPTSNNPAARLDDDPQVDSLQRD